MREYAFIASSHPHVTMHSLYEKKTKAFWFREIFETNNYLVVNLLLA
mgnify:CR=1 FL=1